MITLLKKYTRENEIVENYYFENQDDEKKDYKEMKKKAPSPKTSPF
ncbi:MAG: hypothetical protein JSV92_04030 [archaeon]|nr:MAG: hypothetical protein JSV92_04030 [archaeon]